MSHAPLLLACGSPAILPPTLCNCGWTAARTASHPLASA